MMQEVVSVSQNGHSANPVTVRVYQCFDMVICSTSDLSAITKFKLGFDSDHIAVARFVAFTSNSLSIPCMLGSMEYSMVWGWMVRQ